jgi:hypothetical protein
LFVNERKQSDTQPSHTGTARLAGQMWRVAAWPRETKTGARYLSLKLSPLEQAAVSAPEAAGAAKSPEPASAPQQAEFDDDIPF